MKAYFAAVGENGNPAEAVDLAKQLQDADLKSALLLDRIASLILRSATVKDRDLKLAVNLSQRAVTASAGQQPQMLNTYARALFDSGNSKEAIVQMEKAVAVADKEEIKQQFTETLRQYQQKAAVN